MNPTLRRTAWLLVLALQAALASLAFFASGPLLAHQQKEAITRVLLNPRTGNIEVMHRFLLHDAEHAARALFDGSFDLLSRREDRDRFEAYVHARFTMADQDRVPLTLTPVGNEIENQFLWVYAECPIPEGLSALTLSHSALRDLWPEQVNLVNVEHGGRLRSALFKEGSAEITVRLES
ncbi:MAG: DUF6702 family protein [Pseudomonadota bacterium]